MLKCIVPEKLMILLGLAGRDRELKSNTIEDGRKIGSNEEQLDWASGVDGIYFWLLGCVSGDDKRTCGVLELGSSDLVGAR